MMKRIVFLITLLVIAFNGYAQQKITISKPTMLTGIVTKADFKEPPYNVWFTKNHDHYAPDMSIIKQVKKHLKGITIKAFMGTWCGDSKLETPRFYKILEEAGFKEKNLEMITVDRSKKTSENLQEGLNIIRVPTFIFYKKGKEIGRFVEYPRETLEKDILKILSGKPYKHSYENN